MARKTAPKFKSRKYGPFPDENRHQLITAAALNLVAEMSRWQEVNRQFFEANGDRTETPEELRTLVERLENGVKVLANQNN